VSRVALVASLLVIVVTAGVLVRLYYAESDSSTVAFAFLAWPLTAIGAIAIIVGLDVGVRAVRAGRGRRGI
jgi:hypothetical protein